MHLHFFIGPPAAEKGSGIILPRARKPQDGPGDPFRRSDPAPSPLLRAQALPPFLGEPIGRKGEGGADDPDADAGGERLPKALGQPLDGEFRQAVRQVPWPQFAGARVPEEQDPRASPALPQQGGQRPGQEKRPPQGYRENPLPPPPP